MRQISTWASLHVKKARLLIVIIKATLYLLAVYAGLLLSTMGITLPASVMYPAVFGTFLLTLAIYPKRLNKHLKQHFHYARQKLCDFLLPLCSFLIICCAANSTGNSSNSSLVFASSVVSDPTAAQILASGKARAELSKKEKRILKHEFKKQLKNFVVAKIKNDQQTANNSWKIVLAVIALLGLTFLLAGLVCELSCSGSDAAAVIIGILGLAGLVWAFVAFVKRVNRPKIPKQE